MEIDDEIQEVVPEISLHAIMGVQAPKTIQVHGELRGQSVIALIDSRSTHNFINSLVARVVDLQPNSNRRLEVMVASGKKLISHGRCNQIWLKLQEVPFDIDFFILPLEGCDVVLGTQWLRTLGPIQWDFDKMQMKFHKGGEEPMLCGITNPNGKAISNTSAHSKVDFQHGEISQIMGWKETEDDDANITDEIKQFLQDYKMVMSVGNKTLKKLLFKLKTNITRTLSLKNSLTIYFFFTHLEALLEIYCTSSLNCLSRGLLLSFLLSRSC
ncbi:hypothetical protein ACOSQ3_022650 [Xanthoceras sorbifolium]